MIFHWAVIVLFSAGIFVGISLSQPENVYPVFFGSAGFVTDASNLSVIGAIEVPPSVSNVRVYVSLV